MIDVQHRTLRAFKHHAAALAEDGVEQAACIGDKGANLLGRGGILVVHLRGVEGIGSEQCAGNLILLVAGSFNVGLEQIRPQQIDNALVFVRNPFNARAIRTWLRDPSNRELRPQFKSWMEQAREKYGYSSVLLLAPQGDVRLS